MDTIAQLNAALADRYAIEREIGAGGMATVFLARDLRHDRRVAVKVLKPELREVLGVERFLSEIKVTANLQHPNLLPLFDSGEAGGHLFYVMPYVEGESLRARLDREKQLTIDDAVHIAVGIASALGHAHRNGIIHRDLKPENILLQDGEPMIADFGIALAISRAGGNRMTLSGISVGTPQYMSPEQATADRQTDARTDIYSLGALTYELIGGEPPITGTTAQMVIARLITDPPRDLRELRPTVPDHIAFALHRSLEKLPADRFSTAKEFSDALTRRETLGQHVDPFATRKLTGAAPARLANRRRDALTFALGGVMVAVLGIAAVPLMRGRATAHPPVFFSVESSPAQRIIDAFPAVSPDGRLVAFVASDSGGIARLYVRAVDQFDARKIPGTEHVFVDSPIFFSPDGASLAFVADAKLKRVRVDGSQPPEILSDASDLPQGGSWSSDGSIVFAPDVAKGLVRIPADGSAPVAVTTPDRATGEIGYAFPDVMPDGKAVLYGLVTREGWSVGVHSFASNTNRTLIPGATIARFYPPSTLMYVKDGRLNTVAFDPSKLSVSGPSRQVPLQASGSMRAGGVFGYFATALGSVAGIEGAFGVHSALVRVDRAGTAVPIKESAGERPRISPHGDALIGGDSAQISIFDLRTGGTRTRITSGAPKFVPLFSPDGSRVIYSSYENGSASLYMASLDKPNLARRLVAGENRRYANSWSSDGYVAYMEVGGKGTGLDIYVLRIVGDSVGKPIPVLTTEANEYHPSFSPDGKWLAYASDRTGRAEVYVQAFPNGGTPQRISLDGGDAPVWNRAGHELFYRNGVQLMSVSVAGGKTALEFGKPQKLFQLPFTIERLSSDYDVSPDGKWFVVQTQLAIPPRRLDVMLNWVP